MNRFHLFPGLIPGGICYEIKTVMNARIHYFKDETAWFNILTMLERPWYKRWLFQPWISWELFASSQDVRYRVWVPNEEVGRLFQAKYYAEHPEVEIYPVEDDKWDYTRPHAGTKLLLKRHFVVPLKSYHNDVVDTQSELISFLESLQGNQRIRIQFLLKPMYGTERAFKKAFKELHEEEDVDESMLTENELYKTALQGKKARHLARVSVKVLALADSKKEANALIAAARLSFGQFNSGELNSFYGREWWHIIRPVFRYEFRNRIYSSQLPHKRVVLSSEELAMILRLPSGKVKCNKLERMKMRRTPLPPELMYISANDEMAVHIGENEFHGEVRDVRFDLRGLNRHMAIWGGTMMGKSTFIYNFLEEIVHRRTDENKFGFTVIDPHGNLAVDIASRIPPDKQHLVRYVRFKDGKFPFNVYDVDFVTNPDKIAQNVADVCKRVFKDFWGPNVDDNFMNGGIALQLVGEANLDNLRKVLEDDAFRGNVLEGLSDLDPLEQQLKLFLSRYDDMDEKVKEPKINSTLNKLRKLTLSGAIGGMLRAETNGIKWREGMDEGYFNIFDISGLTIDERKFIGSVCLTFSQLAMLSREDALLEGKSMPLHPIVVDEAPTFLEQSADAIQSFADEARKYNVPLVLGMQGLEGQVPDQVANAIFRNFGTLIAYRVGNYNDAVKIYNGMKVEGLTEEDFQRVDPNYAYMRTAIGRETTLPFLVKMNKPSEALYKDDVPPMILRSLRDAERIEKESVKERVAKRAERVRQSQEQLEKFTEEEQSSKAEDENQEENSLELFVE
ncbi:MULTISPECIES: helicase HerA domain-containing protein [Paenibacillus]|uniref:helicase HerA domain-containing protein n=1 Tax=Paenibacillus TaxID=44249 RepID=UPI001BD14817|nr:DUF87 domain-containing protein [Paenibacillus dendritiformis]